LIDTLGCGFESVSNHPAQTPSFAASIVPGTQYANVAQKCQPTLLQLDPIRPRFNNGDDSLAGFLTTPGWRQNGAIWIIC
jgi:2-methylcitrate dehydratase PrpD